MSSHCRDEGHGATPHEGESGSRDAPGVSTQSIQTSAKVIPGILAPNENVLHALREKFLSVFGISKLLANETLPRVHLQHDVLRLKGSYIDVSPIPGNDFHIEPSITYDESAWSASLRLETESVDESDSSCILVPYVHIRQHHQNHADAEMLITRAATIIRRFWPDASAETAKRRMLGPRFDNDQAVEYILLSWLASKDLNDEGVALTLLARQTDGYDMPYPNQKVGSQPLI
jgi:hypothetical protein